MPQKGLYDLWIGDHNFCTTGFIFGIVNKQAAFIIRQHENLPRQETSELVEEGRIEGGVVFSQRGIVAYEGQKLHCRHVVGDKLFCWSLEFSSYPSKQSCHNTTTKH